MTLKAVRSGVRIIGAILIAFWGVCGAGMMREGHARNVSSEISGGGPLAGAQKLKPAPDFPKNIEWINLKPQSRNFFRGKVTLVYFWDYATINCLRDISRVKTLHAKYRDHGLEVLLIHTPEYEFARERENLEAAMRRFDLPYPALSDNDGQLWETYKNRSWPTKHLIDSKGFIAFTQVGESSFAELEKNLRPLLAALNPSAKLPEFAGAPEKNPFNAWECDEMSGELYLGYRRAQWWGIELANIEGLSPDFDFFYKDAGRRLERGFFAHGKWIAREEFFESARRMPRPSDYVGAVYYGHEVYAVLGPGKGGIPALVFVRRDRKPVPPEYRGVDLQEDARGNTYFVVREPRLYYLIANEDRNFHELRLLVKDPGVEIYGFSFSNRCLTDFDHR